MLKLLRVYKLTTAFFFFNDTATTEIYTLSLHDALPIYVRASAGASSDCARPPGRTSPAQAASHAPTSGSGFRSRPRSPAGPSGAPGPRTRVALALPGAGARAPPRRVHRPRGLHGTRCAPASAPLAA